MEKARSITGQANIQSNQGQKRKAQQQEKGQRYRRKKHHNGPPVQGQEQAERGGPKVRKKEN